MERAAHPSPWVEQSIPSLNHYTSTDLGALNCSPHSMKASNQETKGKGVKYRDTNKVSLCFPLLTPNSSGNCSPRLISSLPCLVWLEEKWYYEVSIVRLRQKTKQSKITRCNEEGGAILLPRSKRFLHGPGARCTDWGP